jgi:hypothetical protein
MLSRYNIAISYKKRTSCLQHQVGHVHRKTTLSFYIGLNCPKIKGRSIYVDYFSQSIRMDANRARRKKLKRFNI